MVAALVDEQAVIGADQQIAGVVQHPFADADRGKGPNGPHGLVPDPANGLRTIVTGQDAVPDREILNRFLGAIGQRDHGAGGKGHAGDLRIALQGAVRIDTDQHIVGTRLHGGQRQEIDLRGTALGIGFDQHQRLCCLTVAGHEGHAAIQMQIRAGRPHGAGLIYAKGLCGPCDNGQGA